MVCVYTQICLFFALVTKLFVVLLIVSPEPGNKSNILRCCGTWLEQGRIRHSGRFLSITAALVLAALVTQRK